MTATQMTYTCKIQIVWLDTNNNGRIMFYNLDVTSPTGKTMRVNNLRNKTVAALYKRVSKLQTTEQSPDLYPFSTGIYQTEITHEEMIAIKQNGRVV